MFMSMLPGTLPDCTRDLNRRLIPALESILKWPAFLPILSQVEGESAISFKPLPCVFELDFPVNSKGKNMRIMSGRAVLEAIPAILIVLWAISGAQPVIAQEKGKPAEKKPKVEEPKEKAAEAKKAAKAEIPASAAKDSTDAGKAGKGKPADEDKPGGKAHSESAGKDKATSLDKETDKHLKRMAQFDRLEKVSKGQKSENAQKKIAMLREKELQRHERAIARLGKEKGGKAGDEAKKKSGEGKKSGKGE
jgi:hypothetical protein